MTQLDSRVSDPETVRYEQPGGTALLKILGFDAPAAAMNLTFADNSLTNVRAARTVTSLYLRSAAPDITGPIPEEMIDDAELCTSELVANGIENGGAAGLTYVRVLLSKLGAFAVIVGSGQAEDGSTPHEKTDVSPEDESGRGLWIVNALADATGSEVVDPATSDKTAIIAWFAMVTNRAPLQVNTVPPQPPAPAIDTLS